ncbi:hypothetical protein WJ542_29250 [Paraburkholderia sp. B3]|uniref:hypothetical protein n=1 Tax=Paraburkholderia sp. B3 TaxID=3134791 RepID=UPI0039821643
MRRNLSKNIFHNIIAQRSRVIIGMILFKKTFWRGISISAKITLLNLVSQTSFNAIGRTIRFERFPDLDFSDDPKTDEVIRCATQVICGVSPTDEQSSEVEPLVAQLSENKVIKRLLNSRNVALLEADHLISLASQPDFSVNRAGKNKSINIWSILKLWWYARTIARSARKAIEVRKAPKVDVTGSDIAQTITLISVSLVTGGFFYQVIFFKGLGIDITRYLSISDYLSSSIGTISPAALSMGINVVAMFFGAMRYTQSNKMTQQVRLKTDRYFLWFSFALTTILLIIEWLTSRHFPFDVLPIFTWNLALLYVPGWCDAYFKRPFIMLFVALYVIYFSASIYAKAQMNAIAVRNGSFFKGDADRVELDDSVKLLIRADQLRLLQTTPNFCFLYDTKSHKVWIFPKEKVKAIYGGDLQG